MQQQEQDMSSFDDEFQRGLESILKPMRESGASQEELDRITFQAKQFYAKRNAGNAATSSQTTAVESNATGTDSASTATESQAGQTAHLHNDTTTPSALASDNAPYPVTFDQIAEMIANGTPIPGIREIPNKINEEAPTEAKVAKMQGAGKKPWEK